VQRNKTRWRVNDSWFAAYKLATTKAIEGVVKSSKLDIQGVRRPGGQTQVSVPDFLRAARAVAALAPRIPADVRFNLEFALDCPTRATAYFSTRELEQTSSTSNDTQAHAWFNDQFREALHILYPPADEAHTSDTTLQPKQADNFYQWLPAVADDYDPTDAPALSNSWELEGDPSATFNTDVYQAKVLIHV